MNFDILIWCPIKCKPKEQINEENISLSLLYKLFSSIMFPVDRHIIHHLGIVGHPCIYYAN